MSKKDRLKKIESETQNPLSIMDFYSKNKWRVWLLVGSIILVYLNSLSGGFVSDDVASIVMDKTVQNPFRPYNLTSVKGSLLSLTYIVFGQNPLPYHIENLILHILVTLTAFFFLGRLVNRHLAFLTMIIFAVHPLNSESVSWISGRAYPLYALFLILALLFYNKAKATVKNRYLWHLVAGFSFLLSFSANPFAIIFPLVLLIYEISFGDLKQNFKLVLAYGVLAAARLFLFRQDVLIRLNFVQSAQPSSTNNFSDLILSPLISFWSYIYLFLFPKDLTFYHEDLTEFGQFRYVLILLTTALAFVLPLIFKHSRALFFAITFYVISLGPSLSPLKVSWVIAERYSYLGNIGLAFIAVYILDTIRRKINLKQSHLHLIILILSLFLGLRTIIRNFDWQSVDSLWLATVKTSPNSSKAWNNMGDYYGRHGDMQASFNAFVKATQINHAYPDAWHNAGNVLVQVGKYDESIPYFEKSLEFNPNLIEAYNNLALVYHKKEDQEKSRSLISKSLQIDPTAVKTYTLLAVIEFENRDLVKAKAAMNKALELDPTNEVIQKNLQILEQTKLESPQNLPTSTEP